jgi:hypothetical protein
MFLLRELVLKLYERARKLHFDFLPGSHKNGTTA